MHSVRACEMNEVHDTFLRQLLFRMLCRCRQVNGAGVFRSTHVVPVNVFTKCIFLIYCSGNCNFAFFAFV